MIPTGLRRDLGMNPGTPVEIYREGEKIVLQKYAPACVFCGGAEDVKLFRGRFVCRRCAKTLEECAAS